MLVTEAFLLNAEGKIELIPLLEGEERMFLYISMSFPILTVEVELSPS